MSHHLNPEHVDRNAASPSIALDDIELIDFHAHDFTKVTVSELIDSRAAAHLDFLSVKEGELRDKMLERRRIENRASPHYRALIHYIADVFGCRPVLEEVDSVLKKKYQEDLANYVRTILDREKIKIAQIANPFSNVGEFPKDRYKWAFTIDPLLQPDWARTNNARNMDEVIDHVESKIRSAINDGLSGMKTTVAYYRGLDLNNNVTQTEADNAYRHLLTKKPAEFKPHYGWLSYPIYDDPIANSELKSYMDFLVKYLMIRSGQLDISFHFHTGGGVSPTMDLRKVNPVLLYPIFYDEDILNANTQIVLLHCGVPFISEAATAASQFPHVYVDTSWPTRTDVIEDIFRRCLMEVSPTKILYGSDAAWIPERLGLGARTARRMLGKVLNENRRNGWTENECIQAANLILNQNAMRLLKL